MVDYHIFLEALSSEDEGCLFCLEPFLVLTGIYFTRVIQ